jgi:RNA polymerase sigma-70 factor (ECF subfamily)
MSGARHDTAATDQELVAEAQHGSQAAFTALFERHHGALERALVRQTGDAELAADLAQETFLDAWRALATLASDRPFAPWLYRIARHNRLSAQRQSRAHRTLSLDRLLAEECAGRPAPAQPDASGAVLEREAIGRALGELSPPQRRVLLLHCLWGFSGVEIARLLGLSDEATWKRLRRATARFERSYRPLCDGGW